MSPAAFFIDTNVPIYGGGRDHALREPCLRVLELVARRRPHFVTSTEVLQEILHHYLAVRSWRSGRSVFEAFANLMAGSTEPILPGDVRRAADLAGTFPELGGRDLLHAAVMQRLGLTRIISADRGFDRLPRIERLDPAELDRWQQLVFA